MHFVAKPGSAQKSTEGDHNCEIELVRPCICDAESESNQNRTNNPKLLTALFD